MKAKNGDTVVISLQNHGAPDVTGAGKSCVWMNSKDYICDSDVALILKTNQSVLKWLSMVMLVFLVDLSICLPLMCVQ